ncbi:MAG: UTP--glucose-1-phosphate uridylyltransferase [Verrucomicrobia bacterium]|nr:UTP--glucose-1-phosphate uridylyltransferase [Verrucomicrobiota bacterium]
MEDLPTQIRAKMEAAGLSSAAVGAFLYQYRKLARNEAGLIPENSISPVGNLPFIDDESVWGEQSNLATQTVLLKLNGGLGTGMGLEKAKSLLRVRDEFTFLDIIARQCLHLRSAVAPQLRLLFMNSFSTSSDTAAALASYPGLGDPKQLELMQNKVPKIDVKTLEPAEWPQNRSLEWCPPGHGDLYTALLGSGLLERLLNEGKKYLFVSNSDNLGATLDLRLLDFFASSAAPFLMEVTSRTAADRKGGHLARKNADQRLLLREFAQCPEKDVASFQNIARHRYFNTNNLWIRLDALHAVLECSDGLLPLPLIRNEKTIDPRDKSTPKVYQLETAMGAAIECFDDARAIEVQRSRFAPVKTTADLLAVRSDAYELDSEFKLVLRPERNGVPPVVKLSDHYKLVDEFEPLIARGVPSLARCHSLTVEGKMVFEPGVEIVGEVKFVAPGEDTKTVAAGTYQNREVAL